MIKTGINTIVKVKMVICKMRTQRSQHKKIVCYCRNLDNLNCKLMGDGGLKCKGQIIWSKRGVSQTRPYNKWGDKTKTCLGMRQVLILILFALGARATV